MKTAFQTVVNTIHCQCVVSATLALFTNVHITYQLFVLSGLTMVVECQELGRASGL